MGGLGFGMPETGYSTPIWACPRRARLDPWDVVSSFLDALDFPTFAFAFMTTDGLEWHGDE
jgi:hypothetical protein